MNCRSIEESSYCTVPPRQSSSLPPHRREAIGHDLIAVVFVVRFLAPNAHAIHHRLVAQDEEDRILSRIVDILVPRPGRDHEEISRTPIETLAVDDRMTRA